MQQINHIVDRIKECGYEAHLIRGKERTVIGVVGNSRTSREELFALSSAPGVEEIVRISHPFKLAARSVRPEGTVLDLGKGVTIGGNGGCRRGRDRAPSKVAEQIDEHRRERGARPARSCCAAARSSRGRHPIAFRDLGDEGLKMMREAADKNGLLVVSEVMDPSQIEIMLPYVDVLQVGARNMQNYHLLRGARRSGQARAAEARNVRHDRGAAAERGIHHGRRKLQSDPVRAGNSHV